MYNVFINIIASTVIEKNNRMFISVDSDMYTAPRIMMSSENNSKLTDCIDAFLHKYTDAQNPTTLYKHLLSVKQVAIEELDIAYHIVLPYNTTVKEPYFLTSYNISIIHPYVRKAIQYL